ncbi:Pleckstrin homology domain [Phaffia rhodozyma]|uniref:Pleckstrin homology domain n=1 Tax=Phaffia rhodozyma TaxID=264483 RepID=A0A0F7SVJ6_PHARH|nr:Pleckstrin homology domain [Phaffia rhodozyma]
MSSGPKTPYRMPSNPHRTVRVFIGPLSHKESSPHHGEHESMAHTRLRSDSTATTATVDVGDENTRRLKRRDIVRRRRFIRTRERSESEWGEDGLEAKTRHRKREHMKSWARQMLEEDGKIEGDDTNIDDEANSDTEEEVDELDQLGWWTIKWHGDEGSVRTRKRGASTSSVAHPRARSGLLPNGLFNPNTERAFLSDPSTSSPRRGLRTTLLDEEDAPLVSSPDNLDNLSIPPLFPTISTSSGGAESFVSAQTHLDVSDWDPSELDTDSLRPVSRQSSIHSLDPAQPTFFNVNRSRRASDVGAALRIPDSSATSAMNIPSASFSKTILSRQRKTSFADSIQAIPYHTGRRPRNFSSVSAVGMSIDKTKDINMPPNISIERIVPTSTSLPTFSHTPASPVLASNDGWASTSSQDHITSLPVVPQSTPSAPPLRSALKQSSQPYDVPIASSGLNGPFPAINRKPTLGGLFPPIANRLMSNQQSTSVRFPVNPPSNISSVASKLLPGKAKERMNDEEFAQWGNTLDGDQSPADPREVLNRSSGTGVESQDHLQRIANGKEHSSEDEEVRDLGPNDVVLRDRMLVKVQWSRLSSLPSGYDAYTQRQEPANRSEPWEEMMVVMRRGRIEIWQNWTFPFQEKFVGKKKLAYVIWLHKETSLSLYSQTDYTFCLTTPPCKPDSRGARFRARMPIRSGPGTSIFIFRPKSHSRSVDWMWETYCQLNVLNFPPPYLDIHVPKVNRARIRIKIPQIGEDPGVDSMEDVLRHVTRRKLIRICAKVMMDVPAWKELLTTSGILNSDGDELEGVEDRLALAWRRESRLDWVWADTDVTGNKRDWNVLAGAGPLYQCRVQGRRVFSKLELRTIRHQVPFVRTKNQVHLTEPTSIEGFVYRIKSKTQVRTQTYFVSHANHLFVCSPSKAHPPRRPTADDAPSFETRDDFLFHEHKRAIQQILGSNGFIDLRDIKEVRRYRSTGDVKKKGNPKSREANGFTGSGSTHSTSGDEGGWESMSEDEEDEGGDGVFKGTGLHEQKKLRETRMFEVEFKSGEKVLFEAHSRLIAREWVDRLNALSIYWVRKLEEQAEREMECARIKHIAVSDILSGRTDEMDREIEDPEDPPEHMDTIWNWCIINGCLPIVKSGRLFIKRGSRQYRNTHILLCYGHLVQFSFRLGTAFHVRTRRISLIDAYVYTGLLAQNETPRSSNEEAWSGELRRYADGLQTADGSDDTCLVIWYRPHVVTSSAQKYSRRAEDDASFQPPPLGKNGHKKIVLRARSKLERDSWAFALNYEMERLVRKRLVREDRIRNAGNVD